MFSRGARLSTLRKCYEHASMPHTHSLFQSIMYLTSQEVCQLLLLKGILARRKALLRQFPLINSQRHPHRIGELCLLNVQLIRLRKEASAPL